MIEPALAHWIYDQLVEHAAAREGGREYFVAYVGRDLPSHEYRFGALLGFGGKFYASAGRYRVSCYREDETPERLAILDTLNHVLAGARAGGGA